MNMGYKLTFIGILLSLLSVNIAGFETGIIGALILIIGSWKLYLGDSRKDFFKMFVFGIVIFFLKITVSVFAQVLKIGMAATEQYLLGATGMFIMFFVYTYFLIAAGERVFGDKEEELRQYAKEVRIWQIMEIGCLIVYMGAISFWMASAIYIAGMFLILLQVYPAMKAWAFMKREKN